MLASLRQQRAEIFGETDETALRAPASLDRRSSIAEEISKRIRPDLKLFLIRDRYAKHFCNHSDRQRIRKLGHELDFRLSRHFIQQRINNLLNTRAQSLNHVRRKLFIQQFAEPAVLRWIEKEHPLRKDLVEGGELRLRF